MFLLLLTVIETSFVVHCFKRLLVTRHHLGLSAPSSLRTLATIQRDVVLSNDHRYHVECRKDNVWTSLEPHCPCFRISLENKCIGPRLLLDKRKFVEHEKILFLGAKRTRKRQGTAQFEMHQTQTHKRKLHFPDTKSCPIASAKLV